MHSTKVEVGPVRSLGSDERALTNLEISLAEATPQIPWPKCIFSKPSEDLFEYRRACRSRTRLVAAVEGCDPGPRCQANQWLGRSSDGCAAGKVAWFRILRRPGASLGKPLCGLSGWFGLSGLLELNKT